MFGAFEEWATRQRCQRCQRCQRGHILGAFLHAAASPAQPRLQMWAGALGTTEVAYSDWQCCADIPNCAQSCKAVKQQSAGLVPNPMPIYTRTQRGHAAALNADSPLPRKLRTLLIAIDGYTDSSVYISSLSAFGDVQTLLESLLNAGLIEVGKGSGPNTTAAAASATRLPPPGVPAPPVLTQRASVPPQDTLPPDWAPQSQPIASAFAPRTPAPWQDSLAEWERTAVPGARGAGYQAQAQAQARTAASQTGVLSGFSPSRSPTWAPGGQVPSRFGPGADSRSPMAAAYGGGQPERRGSGLVNQTSHYQLKQAVSLMSDFVSAHLPMQSIEIVLELERLTSVEQLIASLSGYEALVGGQGEPARRHLAELRAVLSSHA
jgi:hypothetical protein